MLADHDKRREPLGFRRFLGMYSRQEFLGGLSQLGVALASFDRAKFDAVVQQPYPHRQVFAARGSDADVLLEEMKNSLDAYEDGFGNGKGTLHVAAVLYGSAAVFALDDDAWGSYRLAERVDRSDRTNPYTSAIQGLTQRNASFFVCNMALTGIAVAMSNALPETQTSIDELLAKLQAHVVAGFTIVPAGVAALNALQEAKFTYLQATI
jgi:intracellular sulfur oxidation DsrE/DsrF family protein